MNKVHLSGSINHGKPEILENRWQWRRLTTVKHDEVFWRLGVALPAALREYQSHGRERPSPTITKTWTSASKIETAYSEVAVPD